MDENFEISLHTNTPPGIYVSLNPQHELYNIIDIENIVRLSGIPVLSIKGWGSGMDPMDISNFGVRYLHTLENYIKEGTYWVLWDGDNIKDDNSC